MKKSEWIWNSNEAVREQAKALYCEGRHIRKAKAHWLRRHTGRRVNNACQLQQ